MHHRSAVWLSVLVLGLGGAALGCGRTALLVEPALDADAASFDSGRDANVRETGVRDTGIDAFSRDAGIDVQVIPDIGVPDVGMRDTGIDAFRRDVGVCVSDVQCSDGRFCDGVERCIAGSCVAGSPVGCVSDTCNVSTCSDAVGGCVSVRADRDHDGHVPRMCGGDDCDDTNANVFPGRPELCTGGVDDDCNGLVDCMDTACRFDPVCAMPSCPDRVLGSALGVIAMGTTVGASADTQGTCAPTNMAPDLSFQWTAPSTGTYAFDTRMSSFDTVLYARLGCLGAQLGCDDDGGGGNASLIRFALTAGQSIVLFVDGFGSGSGNFVLHATLESAPENCTNGIDDDRDGLIDCADPDCVAAPSCCIARPEICNNGIDDDCDRIIDCADTNCTASPLCCVPRPEICNNGVDDDCDSTVDCADTSCTGSPLCCVPRAEICTNTIDDDCDGLADCSDTDCAAAPACRVCPDSDLGSVTGAGVARGTTSGPNDLMGTCGGMARGPETAFGWTAPRSATWIIDTIGSTYDSVLYVRSVDCNGAQLACDDDAGGAGGASRLTVTLRAGQHVVIVVDSFNTTGGMFVLNINHVATETGMCRDAIDNDADGFIDCVDSDCASDPLCCTPRPEICNDGIDNDCDRATDCADPNCAMSPTCCMPRPEICNDFMDDDCDGLIDCVDPDCVGRPPC